MGTKQKEHLEKLNAKQKGKNNRNWRGGKYINGNGYIMVKSPNHPRANLGGYVFEHILIMEKHLGRFLKENEVTHHLNGIRNDNRIENLVVMTKTNHASLHRKEYLKKKGILSEEEKKKKNRIRAKNYYQRNKEQKLEYSKKHYQKKKGEKENRKL